MELERFEVSINSLRQRVPYHPFTIVLVNGNKYEIDRPEAIMIRDGLGVYAMPGGYPVIFDNEGVSEIIGDLAHQGPL